MSKKLPNVYAVMARIDYENAHVVAVYADENKAHQLRYDIQEYEHKNPYKTAGCAGDDEVSDSNLQAKHKRWVAKHPAGNHYNASSYDVVPVPYYG